MARRLEGIAKGNSADKQPDRLRDSIILEYQTRKAERAAEPRGGYRR